MSGLGAQGAFNSPFVAPEGELLGSGTDSSAWLVDADWVLRVPRVRMAAAALERELALAPLLAAVLDVPVPRFETVTRDAHGVPVSSRYRLLRGEPLSVQALRALPATARDRALGELAAVLSALRAVPVGAARDAGAGLRAHEGFGHPSQRQLHRRHAELLGPEIVTGVEALWHAFDTAGGHWEPVLAHADLKPEHVLHDPATGRLTGILDWGDACLAHPDFDLAIVGLFFDDATRDEVASLMPDTCPGDVAAVAPLLVAVRWLTDLDVETLTGDTSFQAYCVAGLAAHLRAGGREV
jgi:aminoglycoside phosphotransferase (APT) family kinase protein